MTAEDFRELAVLPKTSDLIWQDAQHQVLFDLIKKIDQEPMVRDTLIKLEQYAEHHFRLEELYMKKLNYPGEQDHIAAHGKFRRELTAMLAMDPAHYEEIRKSLSTFLYEWLKRHVMGIDKKLEDHILKSEYK